MELRRQLRLKNPNLIKISSDVVTAICDAVKSRLELIRWLYYTDSQLSAANQMRFATTERAIVFSCKMSRVIAKKQNRTLQVTGSSSDSRSNVL